MDLHSTGSAGMVAFSSASEVDALIKGAGSRKERLGQLRHTQGFLRDLEKVRERGYAIDDKKQLGARCVPCGNRWFGKVLGRLGCRDDDQIDKPAFARPLRLPRSRREISSVSSLAGCASPPKLADVNHHRRLRSIARLTQGVSEIGKFAGESRLITDKSEIRLRTPVLRVASVQSKRFFRVGNT